MDAMQFNLKRKAFILVGELPFVTFQSLWPIKIGQTINIMLWIQATPEKEDWLDLLTLGQPVVFRGIRAGTKDEIITRTISAQYRNNMKFGHGEIWEVSFSL